MKGSSRNKDHSAEGEGAGKRPKRRCLQWHPLLAKKLLDFSEEEEEEDEEEDIDKVVSPFIVEVWSLNLHWETAVDMRGTVSVFPGVCVTWIYFNYFTYSFIPNADDS